jgi:hypothetical protein
MSAHTHFVKHKRSKEERTSQSSELHTMKGSIDLFSPSLSSPPPLVDELVFGAALVAAGAVRAPSLGERPDPALEPGAV